MCNELKVLDWEYKECYNGFRKWDGGKKSVREGVEKHKEKKKKQTEKCETMSSNVWVKIKYKRAWKRVISIWDNEKKVWENEKSAKGWPMQEYEENEYQIW